MRVHHRIPTIFNLSMVDVLCCALGSVILLWLLNLRDARERSLTVNATSGKLQTVQTALDLASGWPADAGGAIKSRSAVGQIIHHIRSDTPQI